jgi:hypothetical protein
MPAPSRRSDGCTHAVATSLSKAKNRMTLPDGSARYRLILNPAKSSMNFHDDPAVGPARDSHFTGGGGPLRPPQTQKTGGWDGREMLAQAPVGSTAQT